ncbi:hypothetical protein AgCh_003239 [Apium graveolens]
MSEIKDGALFHQAFHPSFGLDVVGKNTILYKLKLGEIVTTIPTSREVVSLWDVGGQDKDTQPLLPVEMVEHLRMDIGSKGQIVHIEDIPGRKANYVEIPVEVSENVKSALRRIGITRLYSHQIESIKASLAGKMQLWQP